MNLSAARVIVNASLFAIAAVTLFPLVWMAAVSLMSPGDINDTAAIHTSGNNVTAAMANSAAFTTALAT